MVKRKVDVTHMHKEFPGSIFADTLADTFDDAPPDPVSPDSPPPQATTPLSVEREKLHKKFELQIVTNTALDRSLVSNQANKKLPFYGWFRYKEGFSEPFVDYVISDILKHVKAGILLDPFSGAGSALFAASVKGWQTKGIELLPVGVYATQARFIAERIHVDAFRALTTAIMDVNFADYYDPMYELKHIVITNGAIPEAEGKQLAGYIAYCQQYDEDMRTLLLYAAMCILEEISYTTEGRAIFTLGCAFRSFPGRESI